MHGKKHVFEGLQCLPLYTETPISSLGLGNSLAHYRDEILLTNVCNCISILLSFLKQLFLLGVYMQVAQWFSLLAAAVLLSARTWIRVPPMTSSFLYLTNQTTMLTYAPCASINQLKAIWGTCKKPNRKRYETKNGQSRQCLPLNKSSKIHMVGISWYVILQTYINRSKHKKINI